MFFDIGANVGAWSLANINDCNRIVAVEASPTTFNKLNNNCRNYYNNNKMFLLNYAVCNSKDDVVFYQAHSDVLSTLNKDWLTNETSRFYNQPYKEIMCKTITIDYLIYVFGLPDLIKIDVEGGEYECISSLTQKNKLLCFEWASETNNITFKCLDHLFGLGYTQFYMQNTDSYTFRPNDVDFYDINTLKSNLSNTIPKKDWGMIWCK
jgi:FkbM family methyltransferase